MAMSDVETVSKKCSPLQGEPWQTTAVFLAQVPGAINRGLLRFINYAIITGLLQYK